MHRVVLVAEGTVAVVLKNSAVAGVHSLLVIGQNLASPYVEAIKYDYQFLPLFCLLAASLVSKCHTLLESTVLKSMKNKLFLLIAPLDWYCWLGRW